MRKPYRYLLVLAIGFISGWSTVFLLPNQYEIIIWVFLIVFWGIVSCRIFEGKLFRSAFFLSFLTGMVITATHLFFIAEYLAHHREEVEALDSIKINDSYGLTLLITAPVYWLILGVLSGVTALLIHRIRRKTKNPNR